MQTMVAPVGRSIFRERPTPSADTTVPIVQPMAKRGPFGVEHRTCAGRQSAIGVRDSLLRLYVS